MESRRIQILDPKTGAVLREGPATATVTANDAHVERRLADSEQNTDAECTKLTWDGCQFLLKVVHHPTYYGSLQHVDTDMPGRHAGVDDGVE